MDSIINLKHAIDQLVKEKGIDRQVVLEAMEQAVLTAANKKYRNTRELEAHYNHESGEVELFEFVTVVEEVEDSYKEIGLDEAHEIDPEAEIGDSLGEKLDSSGFSRIAAQTAKQVIIQKVRDAERETIYNEYSDRIWEVITGMVRRFEKGELLGRLRGDTTESAGIQFFTQRIADFGFRIYLVCFIQTNFLIRVLYLFNNGDKLEKLNLSGFMIIMGL